MISIHDLLEDPVYKEFFCKVPTLPAIYDENSRPWRLLVKMRGEDHWRSKEYATYKEAFLKLKLMLPRVADASIQSKAVPFRPPHRVVRIRGKFFTDKRGNQTQVTKMVYWQPKMVDQFQEHHWCPYCRRPTVFDYFAQHHNLTLKRVGAPINAEVMRCSICGASEKICLVQGRF